MGWVNLYLCILNVFLFFTEEILYSILTVSDQGSWAKPLCYWCSFSPRQVSSLFFIQPCLQPSTIQCPLKRMSAFGQLTSTPSWSYFLLSFYSHFKKSWKKSLSELWCRPWTVNLWFQMPAFYLWEYQTDNEKKVYLSLFVTTPSAIPDNYFAMITGLFQSQFIQN